MLCYIVAGSCCFYYAFLFCFFAQSSNALHTIIYQPLTHFMLTAFTFIFIYFFSAVVHLHCLVSNIYIQNSVDSFLFCYRKAEIIKGKKMCKPKQEMGKQIIFFSLWFRMRAYVWGLLTSRNFKRNLRKFTFQYLYKNQLKKIKL